MSMDVNIAEEKAYYFNDQLTAQGAREKALEKKIDAFGAMARFIQRPKTEEIELSYSEKRYEPFWYVSACATYIYERTQKYRVPLADPAVKRVTISGQDLTPQKEKDSLGVTLAGVEHCEDITSKQIYLDGVTSTKVDYAPYMKYAASEIPDLAAFAPEGAIIVPPQVRIAQVVREQVQSLMKVVQADKIITEAIEIDHVALYFRPIYAFEYHWVTKDRKQIVEFDGLTGALRTEGKAMRGGGLKKMIDNDLLFDLSSEAINLVVPGGAIAIKLARAAAKKGIGGDKG